MKNTNRSCLNCHYRKANICSAPVPASIRFAFGRKAIAYTDGTNCPAHRMRTVRARKAVPAQAELA